MKTIAILALVGALATVLFVSQTTKSSQETEFRNFIQKYNRGYGTTEEYAYRLRVFNENMKEAERLSKLNPLARFGVTPFSDLTSDEMSQRMGFIKPKTAPKIDESISTEINAQSVSWEHLWGGYIKNQGNCGSCWSFAVTAAFESRFALARGLGGVDALMAEQQLVDCERTSSGCGGGYLDSALAYISQVPFCTQDQYPYETTQHNWCGQDRCGGGPHATSRYQFPYQNEGALLDGLMSGPIAVCLDANSWQGYQGGILTQCGRSMNHCVTVIASNFEHQTPHIRLRNSWGANWGENGNINLAIGANLCGYADYGEVPTF